MLLLVGEAQLLQYLPGQCIHAELTTLLAGVLTDPTTLTLTASYPGGVVTSQPFVNDCTGTNHADFLVPSGTIDGIGVYTWESSGSTDDMGGMAEVRFQVLPLAVATP